MRVVGLEPTLLAEPDFEAGASTNFTTPTPPPPPERLLDPYPQSMLAASLTKQRLKPLHACCRSPTRKATARSFSLHYDHNLFFRGRRLSATFADVLSVEVVMQASEAERLPRTIRRKELLRIVPLADTTIYDMEQRGDFPRRFALTARCVVWDLAEVEAWLASRKATPITRATRPDVHQRKTRPIRATDRAR